MTRLARHWRDSLLSRLAPNASEAGAALLSAIFFIVLVASLSVVLLAAILSQAAPAFTAQKNTRTVYSAQAGLQAALGLVRTAAAAADASGQVYGAPNKLPCSVNGRVTAEDAGSSYGVTVQYFTSDPTNMSATWRTANQLACSSAHGVSIVPKYAYIFAEGKGSAVPGHDDDPTYGDRALSAIYKFKVTNVNIAGGMIYNSNLAFCLTAVTATVGALVNFTKAVDCRSSALQLWVYDTDYEIKLASTMSDTSPGLCITGPAVNNQPSQNATLQTCHASTDSARWNQLWSWTGSYSWVGQQQNIASGFSGYCLSSGASDGSDLSGRYLQVRKEGCYGSFSPSAQVGAGAAGYNTHQMVNYQEFGRCADVTGENIDASYMISYPCKQDPTGTGTQLKWNHKWYYTEPDPGETKTGDQTISVTLDNGTKYCLTPVNGTAKAYVVFDACHGSHGSGSQNQQWVRVYNTGDYASSYLFIDHYGRCLQADSADLFSGTGGAKFSKVDVAACNGSLAQKWNAPPTYTDSTFGGYREVSP
ncbi:ricin-type beta-trefoil lectin domain protein [Microbacterium sp. STN6]|uniref:ricin-type beta-trefoil lectin domain protein n=1 Tax=Microbacterium sp. STN6 TaxID=2995588 RepID=UPI002260ED2A|nr:ricin-type beta-trefoil lectin domain protein [Microbacterium sp. STN6]MCX7523188.1 ricin-type beta-trefoil lectin domain protein [Microbacterium sp. STN6]